MTAFAAVAGSTRSTPQQANDLPAFNPMSFSLFAREDAHTNDLAASQWPVQSDGKAGMTGRPLNSRASPFQPLTKSNGRLNAMTSLPLAPFLGSAAPPMQLQQQEQPRYGFNQLRAHSSGATTMRVPHEPYQQAPSHGFRMTTHDLSSLTAGYPPHVPANAKQPEPALLQYSAALPPAASALQRPAQVHPPAIGPQQASALLTSSVAASMSHSHLGYVDEKEILLHTWPDNHAALSAAAVVDDESDLKAHNRYAMPHPQHPLVKAAAASTSGSVLSAYSPDVGSGSASDDEPSDGVAAQSGDFTGGKQQQKKAPGTISNGLSDLYKTEICQNWLRTKNCSYGNKCHYAHGKADMRARKRIQTFKTQPCADPARAGCHVCMYSTRCNYCHPGEAVRRGGAGDKPYFDTDYAALLKKDFPHVEAPFGVYV